MKGGPFDINLNTDSVALTLGNREVGYSDPHLHQVHLHSAFSQFEERVLHALIFICKRYSQELFVLDHWKRSRRKSIRYTSSAHSLDTVSIVGELTKPFCENVKDKYDMCKARNTRQFFISFWHTSNANCQ